MAPTVTVKTAKTPAAGATPPAADSTDTNTAAAVDPPVVDPPEIEVADEAPVIDTADVVAEKERAKQAKAEGEGHLVLVAQKTRFRCPQTGIQFPEGQKVLLKKAEMLDLSYNWIKSQIAAGVLTVTHETFNDGDTPDMR